MYVYNFLHDKLLPAIGLAEIDPADIWKVNADDYKECLKITNQTFDAYMLDKLRWYRNETAQLQRRIESTRGIVSESFVKEVMTSLDKSAQEITQLKDENTRLQLELMETRTSMSCRIGLAVTFLPRKIVRLIRGGGKRKNEV